MLSCLSVNHFVVACLRNWSSGSSLCISPLHNPFQLPPKHSSKTVSSHPWSLSDQLSNQTYSTTYAPFKPNKSGQRLPPTYYRGCWHVVSRGLFVEYRQFVPQHLFRPRQKQFTIQRTFFLHAAWLGQASAHCPIFPTAASRRSLARISVPVWGIILSDPLLIIVLVSRYLTN
jgi:hypothetical protein